MSALARFAQLYCFLYNPHSVDTQIIPLTDTVHLYKILQLKRCEIVRAQARHSRLTTVRPFAAVHVHLTATHSDFGQRESGYLFWHIEKDAVRC